jgi:hypothetical protein
MSFRPNEVLFNPTLNCNLSCEHCNSEKASAAALPERIALKFLRQCSEAGIRRVGFTGGEPFLAPDFLCRLAEEAVSLGMLFDRIMTNGAWFRNEASLERSLERLRRAGYDGSICVSVDAFHFHPGSVNKVAAFIRTAVSVWKRPDIVSITCVTGAKERATGSVLRKLAARLDTRLLKRGGWPFAIKNRSLSIRILNIDLSPIGKAKKLKDPWGRIWFREDRCKGPGDVFYVLPDGDVKPCCGYAADSKRLSIGNIRRDSPSDMIGNARADSFISTVFGHGLTAIRRRAERIGYTFPGKAGNICFFCNYCLTEMPEEILEECLKGI